ncbi:hypothetical protein JTE90_028654 [Oedothorax gibbosus]|uniref:Uncharacterized protein n=1 Tax=Oedothorax gibbosus TaxID=931172 RepID=A0AAV6UZK1_9ARAC|nr:hypothetical protein JTE90_028654 [Oedothorax gibbosus]
MGINFYERKNSTTKFPQLVEQMKPRSGCSKKCLFVDTGGCEGAGVIKWRPLLAMALCQGLPAYQIFIDCDMEGSW